MRRKFIYIDDGQMEIFYRVFKFSDYYFKFISWTSYCAALFFAYKKTNSTEILIIYLFSFVILLQSSFSIIFAIKINSLIENKFLNFIKKLFYYIFIIIFNILLQNTLSNIIDKLVNSLSLK